MGDVTAAWAPISRAIGVALVMALVAAVLIGPRQRPEVVRAQDAREDLRARDAAAVPRERDTYEERRAA